MKNDVATLRLVAELNENPWPNRLQNFGRFHENMQARVLCGEVTTY